MTFGPVDDYSYSVARDVVFCNKNVIITAEIVTDETGYRNTDRLAYHIRHDKSSWFWGQCSTDIYICDYSNQCNHNVNCGYVVMIGQGHTF